MELLEIENVNYRTNELECVFDGLFKEGFVVRTNFEYDLTHVEYQDLDINMTDYFVPENISFWAFEALHDEEVISINSRELKGIKQQIENKLTDLLTDYINEN